MKNLFKNSNAKLKNNRGFTIIEIMVTVALLSLLYSLVNASVLAMERAAVADDLDAAVDDLYGSFGDIYVPDPGTTSPGVDEDGLWRGFNPGVINGEVLGGYDVVYMVDYQNRTAEDPYNDINYGSVGGVDVKEGYQITELTGLQTDVAGEIWAYGLLLDAITYDVIETSLVRIPYDNTGSDAQTATNAQLAAKIASSIIGTGIRDSYSNYLAYTYTNPSSGVTTTPNLVTAVVPVGDPRVNSSYSADNGYGITHVMDRNNLIGAINTDMYYARTQYCAWTVDNTVLNGTVVDLNGYLDGFNRDFNSCFAYSGTES